MTACVKFGFYYHSQRFAAATACSAFQGRWQKCGESQEALTGGRCAALDHRNFVPLLVMTHFIHKRVDQE